MMRRRLFLLGTLGLASAAYASWRRRLAITLDDIRPCKGAGFDIEACNRALLDSLGPHRVTLFVCGKRVQGQTLVSTWDHAGHKIANHSFSHTSLNSSKTNVGDYEADIIKGEAVIRGCRNFTRMYRFPFLKEGKTVATRDRVRAFLAARGYRNGHVTIDASDWYYDERLSARLKAQPAQDLSPYRKAYLNHLIDRSEFYDSLSQKVLGRSIPHTLLLHYSLLNALFLKDVLKMFKGRGWEIVDSQTAYEDPVYRSQPTIAPAGESLLWALAREKRITGLRYPGEDGDYEKARLDALGL